MSLHSGQKIQSGELSLAAGVHHWVGPIDDVSEGPFLHFVVASPNRTIHVQKAWFVTYTAQDAQVIVNLGYVGALEAYLAGATEVAADATAGSIDEIVGTAFDVPPGTALVASIEDTASTGTGAIVIEYVFGEVAGEMPSVEA